MDTLKLVITTLLANVAGLLFPIKDDIYGLVLLFSINFLVGMLADVCNRIIIISSNKLRTISRITCHQESKKSEMP